MVPRAELVASCRQPSDARHGVGVFGSHFSLPPRRGEASSQQHRRRPEPKFNNSEAGGKKRRWSQCCAQQQRPVTHRSPLSEGQLNVIANQNIISRVTFNINSQHSAHARFHQYLNLGKPTSKNRRIKPLKLHHVTL